MKAYRKINGKWATLDVNGWANIKVGDIINETPPGADVFEVVAMQVEANGNLTGLDGIDLENLGIGEVGMMHGEE